MRGVSDLIKEHEERLNHGRFDTEFIRLHRSQISFLQHERLAHLIVMLSVALFALVFLALFLAFHAVLLLIVFMVLIVLTLFYIFHYYKLENTVVAYYFHYNEMVKRRDIDFQQTNRAGSQAPASFKKRSSP